MIFRKEFLQKIKKGEVKIAYRRWIKLSVREGGTLKTSIGVIKFGKINVIDEKKLGEKEARLAGYDYLKDLMKDLSFRPEGKVYLIRFKLIGEDSRLKLRENIKLNSEEIEAVKEKLARLDKASRRGPWTKSVLQILSKRPGVGSKLLALDLGIEDHLKLKLNVRKLKNLGLTISLGTGYKLSPRGELILKRLKKK